jgi:hypothetical protein
MKERFGLRHIPHFIVLACVMSLLSSCAGGSALRLAQLSGATVRNEYLSAIASIEKNRKKWYGSKNELLYHMDVGALYHYAGRYDSSTVYLRAASGIYDGLFTRSVTNEAAALLVNDNVRPYRSRPYELALLHQFAAFNYLAQGNVDDALVETRAVQLLFNEWERTDRHGQKYSNDPMFHYISSIAYDAAGDYDDAMISLFKAVEAFNAGPVPLPTQIRNYACWMLKLNGRAQDTMLLGITSDLPREKVSGLGNGLAEIILVGYAGRGPALVEEKWSGTYVRGGLLTISHRDEKGRVTSSSMAAPPLPRKEYEKAAGGKKNRLGTTFHISFSLPALRTFGSSTAYFTVSAGGGGAPFTSVAVNNFERQLAKNLEDTRTATLMRTVVRTTLRTIAAQKAKGAMKSDKPMKNFLLNIGTDLLADQLERADTRSCFLIPRTVQVARMPVKPGTYEVRAAAHGTGGAVMGTKTYGNVTVKQGEKKFLFYCSFK